MALLLALVVSNGWAQRQQFQELPPPPPPPDYEPDAADVPQVTVIERAEERVEEVRLRGKLVLLRVLPRHGVPYYIYYGEGEPVRLESLDQGFKVPLWLLRQF